MHTLEQWAQMGIMCLVSFSVKLSSFITLFVKAVFRALEAHLNYLSIPADDSSRKRR